jgi:hypothetical protein
MLLALKREEKENERFVDALHFYTVSYNALCCISDLFQTRLIFVICQNRCFFSFSFLLCRVVLRLLVIENYYLVYFLFLLKMEPRQMKRVTNVF